MDMEWEMAWDKDTESRPTWASELQKERHVLLFHADVSSVLKHRALVAGLVTSGSNMECETDHHMHFYMYVYL